MGLFRKKKSYISRSMTLKGDLETQSNVSVHGTVYGDIRSKKRVTLGKKGRIEGNIESKTVVVSGCFKGTITAKRLIDVKAPAHIVGDLISDSVRLASGVSIQGNIQAKTLYNPEPETRDEEKVEEAIPQELAVAKP